MIINLENYKCKPYCTISRKLNMSSINKLSIYSLAKGTSISSFKYETTTFYYVLKGSSIVTIDNQEKKLEENMFITVDSNSYFGIKAISDIIYLEIQIKDGINMTELIKAGNAFKLKDLIDYEEGGISNLDIASNDSLKYVLMAFDENQALSAHKAPCEALVFILEGKAIIGYEGVDYTLNEGEVFKFDKGGLHAVKALTKMKMALLLTLK